MIIVQRDECYVGESREIGVRQLKDTDGAFVNDANPPTWATYEMGAMDGTSLDAGILEYETDSDGTWRAFPLLPTEAQRVKVGIEIALDSTVRRFLIVIDVRDY